MLLTHYNLFLSYLSLNDVVKLSKICKQLYYEVIQDQNYNPLSNMSKVQIEVHMPNCFCPRTLRMHEFVRLIRRCTHLQDVDISMPSNNFQPNLIKNGLLLELLQEVHCQVRKLKLQVSSSPFYQNTSNIENLRKNVLVKPQFENLKSIRLNLIDDLTHEVFHVLKSMKNL